MDKTTLRPWHPWLRIERLTRVAIAARLRMRNSDADDVLAALLVRRHEIASAGLVGAAQS